MLSRTLALLLLASACREKGNALKTADVRPENVRSDGGRAEASCPKDDGVVNPHLSLFFSQNPWEWREAAIWLANKAPPSLEVLECTPGLDRPEIVPRVVELVSLALLKRANLSALQRSPTMHRIVVSALDRASALARNLEGITEYDSGEDGPLIPGTRSPPLSPTRRTLNELVKLQGYAVPAAIQLLGSQNHVARAHAATLLGQLGARSAIPQLERAIDDAAMVAVSHGDYVSQSTVGHFARSARQHVLGLIPEGGAPPSAPVGHSVSMEIEGYIHAMEAWISPYDGAFLLANGIRQSTKAFSATSWDQWWEEARPVWRLWWENDFETKPRESRSPEWYALLRKSTRASPSTKREPSH